MEIKEGQKDMKVTYLTSEGIIRSLHSAFNMHINVMISSNRIRGMLAHLSSNKLYIKDYRGTVSFHESTHSGTVYLRKNSDKLYRLARKRYLETLLQTIELVCVAGCDSKAFNRQFEKLAKLIHQYAKGNLDVARIVLTNKQYNWLVKRYKQKEFSLEKNQTPLYTDNGVMIRSKSEQNIGNRLWHFAAPMHYEEQLQINVMSLVEELEANLSDMHQRKGSLYFYRNGVCYWNVPDHLMYMNLSGSVWHTFNYRTGCITIYPDYTIMLIDGSLLYWEHEGLLLNFTYRANATERVSIMRICGSIDYDHLLQTTELESNNRQILDEIIKKEIIPQIWF